MTDPIDASTIERVRASFARQGLMTHLGARLGDIERGRVTLVLARRPELSQQHGYIHAGATTTIADSAGGYAALTMFDSSEEVLTVELKINLVAPAAGHTLEAVGRVVKAGRTLTVCTTEVFDREHDRLVAVGQQTVIRVQIPARDGVGPP